MNQHCLSQKTSILWSRPHDPILTLLHIQVFLKFFRFELTLKQVEKLLFSFDRVFDWKYFDCVTENKDKNKGSNIKVE